MVMVETSARVFISKELPQDLVVSVKDNQRQSGTFNRLRTTKTSSYE